MSTTSTCRGREHDLIGIADSGTLGTVGAKEIQYPSIFRSREFLETFRGAIITTRRQTDCLLSELCELRAEAEHSALQCCRLQLDLSELIKRGNGLFGSAEQSGSVGVVRFNCARLGYLHHSNEAALLQHLDELLEIARTSLEIKRETI